MLLGRDVECQRLDGLLDAARAGTSGVLVVRGDPGVGKTALLEHAVSRAADMRVLSIRGVESEIEIGFAGLFALFRPVLDRLDQIPAAQADALRGALGLGPQAGTSITVAIGTLSLLAAVADDAPVLVTIDDAQWLDQSTRSCLLFTARQLQAEGIAMLWTVCDGEPEQFAARDLPALALNGLSPAAAAELLSRARGESVNMPRSVGESIVSATGGNPLALVETPTLLPRVQLEGRAPLEDPLPVGRRLGEAYLRQVAKLPPATRTALVVAAAAGDASVEVLETAIAALGLPPPALAPAEVAGLVATGENGIQWRHPLLRSAVWRAASATERRVAHRAIAGVQSGERRAWHLAAAASGADDQVAAALDRAADEARVRGAFAEAALGHERAAKLTRDPSLKLRRLVVAAEALTMCGESHRAAEILDRATAELGDHDPIARADAQHLRGRIDIFTDNPRRARDRLLAESELVAPVDFRRALTMLIDAGVISLMVLAEVAASADIEQRALIAAQAAGQAERTAAAWLHVGGLVLRGDTRAAQRVAPAEEPPVDPGGVSLATETIPLLMIWLERHDECREFLARRSAKRRSMGMPPAPIEVAALAQIDWWSARWRSSRPAINEAIRLALATGQVGVASFGYSILGLIEAAQGHEAECRRHARTATEIADRCGSQALLTYPNHALGLLDLGLGRPETAIVHLRRVAERADETGLGHPSVVPFRPDLVEAHVLAGQRGQAEKALAVIEEQAVRTGLTWPAAAAARCRGLLERAFRPHFEKALELHARLSMPFELARTELRFGGRLRRARCIVEARRHLHAALAIFEEIGAQPWAEMARIELRASGEHVPLAAPSPLAGLTSQELEIATRAANGEKNVEIAAALQLSPKTIEFHLSKVYQKLKLRSRTDLARLYANRDASHS